MTGFVSILMPALNEEAHIEEAIRSVLPEPRLLDAELLVLDGGSTDRTRELVLAMAAADPRIRLVHNPKRLQAAAINLGAQAADPRASFLVRADCHALYPENFVALCLEPLQSGRASSVVVPLRTVGKSFIQRAVAIAQNSRLGNGGSAHRSGARSRYVDHGHHAAFRRDAFLSVGGYRETMPANEDAELDVRLVRSGAKIWLCQEAEITYFPRRSLWSLARQYFAYGKGRADTCLTHRIVPKLRQLLPVMITTGVSASVAGLVLDLRLGLPALLYALACQTYAIVLWLKTRDPAALLSGLAAMTMHMAWGAGFLVGILRQRSRDTVASSAKGISMSR